MGIGYHILYIVYSMGGIGKPYPPHPFRTPSRGFHPSPLPYIYILYIVVPHSLNTIYCTYYILCVFIVGNTIYCVSYRGIHRGEGNTPPASPCARM